MTDFDVSAVPGVAELLGKGIYTAMPEELPDAVRGQHAVVVGEAVASAMAAIRLSACAFGVTLVLRESGRGVQIPRDLRSALRRRANIRTWLGTELAWAVGVDHLEVLVLRGISTGRIEACNADALFLLSSRVLNRSTNHGLPNG